MIMCIEKYGFWTENKPFQKRNKQRQKMIPYVTYGFYKTFLQNGLFDPMYGNILREKYVFQPTCMVIDLEILKYGNKVSWTENKPLPIYNNILRER